MLQKIALAGFGIILLASPLLASADTASDLQAKIDAILGQVRELQAQYEALVKQPPTTSVPPMASIDLSGITCPRLGRALAFGARGDDVAGLQKVLIAAGGVGQLLIHRRFNFLDGGLRGDRPRRGREISDKEVRPKTTKRKHTRFVGNTKSPSKSEPVFTISRQKR